MAENKKTFIFYSDWVNMIREMPDEDAGQLLKHILSYVNDEDPDTKNILVRMAFAHMKPLLKQDLQKWETIRTKRKEAGKKGGQANAKQNQANAKQLEAVNDNVNVNVNGNVNEKKEKYEKEIPNFQDFLNHCKTLPNYSRDYDFSIQSKYDAWKENGWKDGNGNKIKNWKTKLNNTWPHMKPILVNGKSSSPQTVSFKNKI
jgi:hypothetical protein